MIVGGKIHLGSLVVHGKRVRIGAIGTLGVFFGVRASKSLHTGILANVHMAALYWVLSLRGRSNRADCLAQWLKIN